MASRYPFEANDSSHHRNDSFYSYFALVRQSFTNELANSRRSSFQPVAPSSRTSRDHKGELDVFTAEKYFNGSLDVQDWYPVEFTSNDREKNSKKNKSLPKSRSSACSDTSANSRTLLLGCSRPRQQKPYTDGARVRRSFFDVFRCYCSKKSTIISKAAEDADVYSDKRNTTATKLPSAFIRSSTGLNPDSSSEFFEIDVQAVYEPSEASTGWSIRTASTGSLSEKKRRPSSGPLALSCVSEKAISVAEDQKVGLDSMERHHVMMDLEPENAAEVVVARSRRTSLG